MLDEDETQLHQDQSSSHSQASPSLCQQEHSTRNLSGQTELKATCQVMCFVTTTLPKLEKLLDQLLKDAKDNSILLIP